MKINLILDGNEYVTHHAIVTVPEEKVEIEFRSHCYIISELILSVVDNDGLTRYKTRGESIDISQHCQRAGEVKLSCSLVLKGEVLKTWQIESLLVKEIPDGRLVISELEDFRKRIETIESAIIELANQN